VVVADIEGAFSGGIWGFTRGAVLGGFGVAGACIGAVGGGVLASTKAGLIDYLIS
jgi:uncharacterized membrane protein